MSDALILELVYLLLDDGDFEPEAVTKDFEYYTTENLVLRGKKYRLIWLIEKDQIYLGVVNAYRGNDEIPKRKRISKKEKKA